MGRVCSLRRKVPLQCDVALLGRQLVWQCAHARRAYLESDRGQRQGDERGHGNRQADSGMAKDSIDDRSPESALRICTFPGAPADNRQPARVDTIAQYAEQRRQQGKRHRERRDADEDRSRRQTAEDRGRHQEQAEHRDYERRPAEQDRAAGRGTGRHDRVVREPSATTLLAVTGDDEKGVIDPKR